MRSIKNILFLAGFVFLIVAGFNCKTENKDAGSITGRVVSIADGDTFTLLTDEKKQIKIRLYGIDCPEKRQPFGTAAKQKLSDMVFGRHVRIKQMDIDRYKRTVAIVYNEANTCINEEMLKTGFAWHYLHYDDNAYWQQLQENARSKKIGLWAENNPVPPWQWRSKNLHR